MNREKKEYRLPGISASLMTERTQNAERNPNRKQKKKSRRRREIKKGK